MSLLTMVFAFAVMSESQVVDIEVVVDTAFYAPIGDGFDDEGLLDGYVSYDIFAVFQDESDALSAIYSDVVALGTEPFYLDAPCGCFNPELGDVLLGASQNPALLSFFPEIAYDTYWTLGYAMGEQIVNTNTDYSSTNMCSEQESGGSIFTIAPEVAGDDLRIQIAKVTTCGDFSIHACFQVFVEGDQSDIDYWCMDGDGAGPLAVSNPCDEFATSNSEVEITSTINCFGDLAEIEVAGDGASLTPISYGLYNAVDSTLLLTQQDDGVFANLGEGEYFVTIVDGNTCRDTTDTFSFVNPPELNASWELLQDNQCPGDQNSIVEIAFAGGTEPIEFLAYSESAPGNNQLPENDQWIGLPCVEGDGNWTFEITDFYGCTLDTVIALSCIDPFDLTLNETDISCFDYGDGQIDGVMSGGSGTLTLTAFPPLPEEISGVGVVAIDLDNVPPGLYNVTLTDGNGCTEQTQVNIDEPSPVLIELVSSDLLCSEVCNGSVEIEASGGSGAFDYFVTNEAGEEQDLNALCSGLFIANAIDENGCVIQDDFAINAPDSILFDLSISDVSCAGEADGEICVLNAQGGTGELAFQVNPPADGFGAESCFDLAVGTYTISVSDESGCIVNSEPQTLIEPEAIQLILSSTPISCASFADGTVLVDAVGGTGALTIQSPEVGDLPYSLADLDAGDLEVVIEDENGCSVSGIQSVFEPDSLVVELLLSTDLFCGGDCSGTAVVDFAGGTGDVVLTLNASESYDFNALCAGNYTAEVMDSNGCMDSTLFEIIEPDPIEVLIDVTEVTCTGMSDGAVNIFPVGGTGVVTWEIEEQGIDLFNLFEGVYHITAVDETGCVEDTLFEVGADEDTDMILNMLSSPVTCWNEQDGTATASITGGYAPIEYLWSDERAQGTATATGLYEDTYAVVVTDSLGCTLSSVVSVEPTIGCFFIADAITPNGDGYNDEWIVGGLEYFPTSDVSVYNRWGQLLFNSLGYVERWDGRFNNAPLPVADYYYVIDFNGELEQITGTVTLKY
jgi:gliding motility-associated-like protein